MTDHQNGLEHNMDNKVYYQLVEKYLSNCTLENLMTPIIEGSGVFHIANVPPASFNTAWVSANPGRFSKQGEKVRYYANEFDVSARELGYTPGVNLTGVVFVAAELKKTMNVIDVYKLPQEIKQPLFANKKPETKWEKSHIFMEAVQGSVRFENTCGVNFPSASGQMLETGGSCLALFDPAISTTVIGSGDYTWWKSRVNPS